MAEREYTRNTKETDVERSSEDIRQDIADGEENISQTVGQISERIREKLDWRGYVKDSPYWAIGAAAGLGYLASRMFVTRTTPMERIMSSIAEEVRDATGGLHAGAARPGIIRMTLIGIATKAAASWIKKAMPTDAAGSGDAPDHRQDAVQTISPKADTSETIKINSNV